ncbi:MAG: class I SAM-dependent methyltransferase [Candidatus Kariarchaeaceae archaeon]|jgi:ubiquinone/menaquinone biosynthesis C-methylase UbiE
MSELLEDGTNQMLDMADVQEGHSVLDIAAGDGDQSLKAAKKVGSSGYVLATDISTKLLDYASKSAKDLGYDHLETRLMDAGKLELEDDSFNAVICRNGLMLLPNLPKVLSEIFRVLKPGGKLSAMVFSLPERNPWISVPAMIAMKKAQRQPKPGMPGLFSLAPPGLVEKMLEESGFQEVRTVRKEETLQMESASECFEFVREIAGAIHSILAPLTKEEQDQTWSEIHIALRQFENENGFSAPTEFILLSGVKK